LPDWERKGWLTRHASSSREIGELPAIADRDIADIVNAESLGEDWALTKCSQPATLRHA
jgi:hypothetical protein